MKLNIHISRLALGAAISMAKAEADVTIETSIQSLYLERGLKTAEITSFPSIEFSKGDLYVGLWAAVPLEKTGAPNFFEDETDFYAGYGWALGKKWALDVGAISHHPSKASESREAYMGLIGELGTFSPTIYIYKDFDTKEFLVEASTTVAIPLQGFPFRATGRVGVLDGQSNYSYFGLDLVYPVKLADYSVLSLGLHYDDNDFGLGVPDSSIYGSASVRLSF